jgi:hypothetical protein
MSIASNVLSGRLLFLAILFLGLSLAIPTTRAQNDSAQSGHEIMNVVGHLPLNGMRVNQMFVQLRDGKYYLYLHRPMKQVFAVVDVSKPDKPVLLSRDALKGTQASQIEPTATGSGLALTVTPDQTEGQSVQARTLPTETVQLLNISDPKNVKVMKSFKGVTSIYPDDGRKLVYLVNSDGLWIVSHRMTRPLPLCDSESALTPFPDCQ